MHEIIARQILLFIHAIAFALAIASLLRADLALLRATEIDPRKLARTATRMTRMLSLLWVTGISLVAIEANGSLVEALALAAKPKLAAKLLIVSLLTVNGFLLHRYAFPAMTRERGAAGRAATICACLGAISSASWLCAAFVGTARIVGPLWSHFAFLGLYLAAVAAAVAVALWAAQPRLAQLLGRQA